MIDLGLNQYKIKEIKYEVKENKIVTFKLCNFNLEDVIVEEIDASKKDVVVEEIDASKKDVVVEEIDASKNEKWVSFKDKECKSRIEGLSKIDVERCKELIGVLNKVPYKVMGKIGELMINENGEGLFVNEPDPYVVNDERELPKQKKVSVSTKNEKLELEDSKEKECKVSNIPDKIKKVWESDLNKKGTENNE